MTDPRLADAAAEFLLFARGGGPGRIHAAGEAMAEEFRRSGGRADDELAAFASGMAGRRWEPWGESTPREARPDLRMTGLALRFPSLRRAPGVEPWNPCALDDWAPSASSGELWAASFLLWAVWNADGPWRTPPFRLRDAWAVWDDGHRAAASSWLREPYFP
jgi:hypothetical protein